HIQLRPIQWRRLGQHFWPVDAFALRDLMTSAKFDNDNERCQVGEFSLKKAPRSGLASKTIWPDKGLTKCESTDTMAWCVASLLSPLPPISSPMQVDGKQRMP